MSISKFLDRLKKNIPQIITIFVSVSIAYYVELKLNNPIDIGHFVVMAAIYSALGLISLKFGMGSSKKKNQ
ncbi:TPA: hypothetical protein ACHKET_000895 [Acinetobacter baumannii]|uniref:Uncharacterized protein n=1 Tax=Acinetobacter haemolyticus CIP 64.3 = MTCC 9819 TaxID=1217659 RepID=N9EZE5_ACIHA|nr:MULTISPECIES: hypothetical protein [Acinetobacter]ENW15637.1 hypothetical protein F927_03377 [Acinetobacter haemolyticus CIP 64.3 = MTCC 9819]EPR90409.1 hypothetical protein L313_2819 [Acinetobacter haemolyticus CIP 64.3 = MTCC 9819]MCF4632821.1 hypothetical protein [Acinetobacter baumannii]QXZ26451.1 hypothetical protein I6L22_14975 [Acinetobacter haemolyticus]SPT48640.1 Uncharacterised protein [Acinetobacter haemolyticus]